MLPHCSLRSDDHNIVNVIMLLKVVTAMGRTWHPEHFVCTHCQEEIGSRNFFERDGQPYCEKDYHNLFSPRCYYCNGPILDVSEELLHQLYYMLYVNTAIRKKRLHFCLFVFSESCDGPG